MSTDAVSPLRQRMIEDMNARKLGSHTQNKPLSSCKRFAAFLKRSLDTATAEDIRQFQLQLSQTSVSICNRNRIMTGLRFVFRVTLRRLDLAAELYHVVVVVCPAAGVGEIPVVSRGKRCVFCECAVPVVVIEMIS